MSRSPKKKVSVSFAGDDNILHHICPDSTEKAGRKVDRKRSLRKSSIVETVPEEEKENTDIEDEGVFKYSDVLSEGNEIVGNKVFGFKTPKKSGQMAQKVSESLLARTPKSGRKSTSHTPMSPRTPKSILKTRDRRVLQETGTTPANKRSSKRLHKMAAQTPHRLRTRLKEDSSDASTSEDSAVSDSDSETEPAPAVAAVSPKPSSTPGVTPSKKPKGKLKKDKDSTVQAETVESYFDAQNVATVTSDRTLAKLDHPRMDQEQLNEALEGVELPYSAERKLLRVEYREKFDKWMYLLCNNYNLLFHGLGSKRQLLEDFRKTFLVDFNHIVINGFFPSLTIKSILTSITEDLLQHRGSFRSPVDQCDFIRKQYEHNEYEDLYLVIHNIDGPMLRPEKVQAVLSLLAQITGIHILASIDHINAPLIWDHTKASRFNWLWFDVTSYDSYTEETSYENSLLVQQSGVLALSSLTHVMRSLTPNAKGIFLLLVKYQIENKDSSYQGLAFPDLYQKCREAFLVNSDLTLRTQLTEFKDHKLVRTKKGYDGVEYLVVPLDEATLKEFLEQLED